MSKNDATLVQRPVVIAGRQSQTPSTTIEHWRKNEKQHSCYIYSYFYDKSRTLWTEICYNFTKPESQPESQTTASGKQVGECLCRSTHAQTDGLPENIMPPVHV